MRHPALPWIVWGTAALAYAVAVINRSSLAALGPATQEHFSIDATVLATFAVIQLIVYAGMQIPVGVLLDRYGSTMMILAGGVLMSLGQLAMATVHDVSLAILARILIGAGDACTFISVIRMLPEWFSVRQLPIVGQLTGLIGQIGQLVSVTPLAIAVNVYGWSNGFIGVAAVGLLMVLIGAYVLRDRPGDGTVFERVTGIRSKLSTEAQSLGVDDNTAMLAAVAPPATSVMPVVKASVSRVPGVGFWRKAKQLLSVPGVRLSFWLHFTSPFAPTVVLLLWGTPFLVGGIGLSQSAAGSLLSLTIVSSMVVGLLLGPISSRFVRRRVWINFGVTVSIAATWLSVLLWPGVPPVWLLVVLMLVISMGGPASMIAFEVLRSHVPRSFSGFGTGFVNMGGFISALIVIFFIGIALDLQGAGSPERYTLVAFQWAFAVQIPVWLLGLCMILLELKRTKAWMQHHGRELG